MANDATSKLALSIVNGLANTQTNVEAVVNAVIREADNNDYVQAVLWGFIATYIYNRSARYQLGLARTDNQDYIGYRCYKFTEILDHEYKVFRDTGKILPGTDLTDFDRK